MTRPTSKERYCALESVARMLKPSSRAPGPITRSPTGLRCRQHPEYPTVALPPYKTTRMGQFQLPGSHKIPSVSVLSDSVLLSASQNPGSGESKTVRLVNEKLMGFPESYRNSRGLSSPSCLGNGIHPERDRIYGPEAPGLSQ